MQQALEISQLKVCGDALSLKGQRVGSFLARGFESSSSFHVYPVHPKTSSEGLVADLVGLTRECVVCCDGSPAHIFKTLPHGNLRLLTDPV